MIGIFDSGYGGLTVFKPIIELLPEYDYIYLGDSARAPYGGRSGEVIKKFSEEAVEFLFKHGANLIIFACNTASSLALRHVQEKYLKGPNERERKILGVLIPVAEEAVKTTKNGHIGVIGTKATIQSKVYETEIHKLKPHIKVFQQACPLLVPFIEENWHKKPEANSILKKYLLPLKSTHIDTLIPGCTHYPLMIGQIEKYMGKKTKILHSGEITAGKLKEYLERHPEIDSKLAKNKNRTFFTTDNPRRFKEFTEQHFGMKIKMPAQIELG
ncbi:glutamate racemase [Candidatus Peregrinibacteria bacterium]|nr:glutamate racemase [Candidatus Peregrinibacteria bacterium]